MNMVFFSTIYRRHSPGPRTIRRQHDHFSHAKNGLLPTVFAIFHITLFSFFILFPAIVHGTEDNLNLETETARLAQQGDAQAQFSLAMMYEEGRRLPRNSQKNIYWLTKAARQDLPAACLYLGMKFQFGNGVRQDRHAAAKLYEKAAVQDWAMAQYLLAMLLLDEDPAANRMVAGAWLKTAGTQGYPQAEEKYREIARTLTEQEKKQLRAYVEQFGKQIKKNAF